MANRNPAWSSSLMTVDLVIKRFIVWRVELDGP